MAEITKQVTLIKREMRSLYGQSLMALLLPFVFLITAFQEGPPRWRDGLIKGGGIVLLFSLGLACVLAIRDTV